MAWMIEPDGAPRTRDGHARNGLTRGTAELQHSTGRDNEKLFLHLMTRHHQGGITMATFAFQHGVNDAVRRAASVMVDEQTQEIQLMSMMLDVRLGAP